MTFHIDTHVALWIAQADKKRLRPVQALLTKGAVFLSPIVVLEMEVLREIGRVGASVSEMVAALAEDHDIRRAEGDLMQVAERARTLGWTRDPFDRLIVAHAQVSKAKLLTADCTIRDHFKDARWDD